MIDAHGDRRTKDFDMYICELTSINLDRAVEK